MLIFERIKNLWHRSILLPLVVLFVVALLPYSNIFPNEFAFDDFDFFVLWEEVKNVENISSFFEGTLPVNHQHVYRPVRSVIQSVVYTVSDGQPFGFHIFSLFVQIFGTVLIYCIARKILKPAGALVTGLVFAVLPIHTDAITFMTASFDTAGAIIMFGSFYIYLLYRNSPKYIYYIVSLLLALIAFFSYEIALTLPILFLAYDFFVRENSVKELLMRWKIYLPFLAAALSYVIVRTNIVGSIFTGSLLEPVPFFDRTFTMLKAFISYVYLTIVGTPLSAVHVTPIESSLFSIKVFFSSLALLGIAGAAVYFFKTQKKLFSFAIVWFFVALLPVSNIVPLSTFVAEHYVYTASFGWALLVGLLFETARSKIRLRHMIILLWTAVLLLVGVYGYLTFDRNFDWKDSAAIFNAALALNQDYAGGYNGLAFQYRMQKNYDQAIQYAQKAIEKNQNYYISYALLGEIAMEQGRCEEAIPYFDKVIELNNNYVSSFLNRGVCFFNLNRFAEAESDFVKALALYPDYVLAHRNLGMVYAVTQQYDKAVPHLERAVQGGNDVKAEYTLGVSLLNVGRLTEAKTHLENVLRTLPENKEVQEALHKISQ